MKYVGLFASTLVFLMLLSACQNIQDDGNSPDGQLSDNGAIDVGAINDVPTDGDKKGSDCPIFHELERSQRDLQGQINTIVDRLKEEIIVPESGNVRSLAFYPNGTNEDARPEDEKQVDLIEPIIESCLGLSHDIEIVNIETILLDRKFRESISTETPEITARSVFSRYEQLDAVVFREIQYNSSINRIQVNYSVVGHNDDVPSFVLPPLYLSAGYQIIPYDDPYHRVVTEGRVQLYDRPFGNRNSSPPNLFDSLSTGHKFEVSGYIADSFGQPLGHWKEVVVTERLSSPLSPRQGKPYYAIIDLTEKKLALSDDICDSLVKISDNFDPGGRNPIDWYNAIQALQDEIENKGYCHIPTRRSSVEKCIGKIMERYSWEPNYKAGLLKLSRCEL